MTSTTPKPPEVEPRSGQQPGKRRAWPWILLAVVVVLGGLTLVVWMMPTATARQNETISGTVQQLTIEVTGAVSLEAGETTDLTITKEWVFGGEPTVDIDNSDGSVVVNGECSWFQARCTTAVRGTVARDANIIVRTSAGSVEVTGTANGVDLETSAGAVRAHDIIGNASLHTSAGNIVGTITDGDVEAETSAGSIDLSVLGEFSSVFAETSAGNVDLTVPDEVYAVDADTSAGSVTTGVRTDPSSSRHITAGSSAGSITIRPAS